MKGHEVAQFLSAAIGVVAAREMAVIEAQLPALYSSTLSRGMVWLVPPVACLLIYPFVRRAPPILAVLPLLCLPPVAAAAFPLAHLVIFSVVVALVAALVVFHNLLPTTVAFAVVFLLPPSLPQRLTDLLRHLPGSPALLIALVCTHLAARSQTYASLRSPQSARRRSYRSLPPAVFLLLVSIAAFAISALFETPLANLLRLANPRPMPPNYTIRAQARGPTGLISVVDVTDRYRMLTADYSILGGYHQKPGYFPDSIFGQFYVHEFVRLSRVPGESRHIKGGRDGRALCIGVGAGIVTQGLHQLGSTVHPVELDHVVARFARTWFGVKPYITVADGMQYISKAHNESYDFVVHDIFTGGSTDTLLFSEYAFSNIKRILKPDGVLAVNFVGALDHPPSPATHAAALVYWRLKQIYGNVRVFSDGYNATIHNFVYFAGVAAEVAFREGTNRDWMNSPKRQETFEEFQKFEVSDEFEKVQVHDSGSFRLFQGMWDISMAHRTIMREQHPIDLWPALLAAETVP